ncbi:MAG: type A chloramphenicol O-acetyltransferase [Flavobacteriaceae bacterium]|jgi:chloramphenicol O-acetyltransferase type A|nr:type A chloramphenicol O-acetyltransferase [Flavobacteriaceae bacterium]
MKVNYQIVDIENWKRKEHFAIYRSALKCGFSLTVKLEISQVLKVVKAEQLKLYPVMIHLISKAVNRHNEFKMAMKDGQLIIWDRVDPVYTVLHPETETFSALTTTYQEKLEEFIMGYNQIAKTHGDDLSFSPVTAPENHFNISALPWVNFEGFNLNIADFTDYFPPSFTIGKYQKIGEEVWIPLAIQVHHAVCDGIHVAKFIDTLQEYCKGV